MSCDENGTWSRPPGIRSRITAVPVPGMMDAISSRGGSERSRRPPRSVQPLRRTPLHGTAVESLLDIRPLPRYIKSSQLYMPSTIRNLVKDFRAAKGWTQQELAEAVGVSRQSINSIERNRYVPSLLLALTFARVFECTTDELFQVVSDERLS